MKKIFLLAVLVLSNIAFSQNTPILEQEGSLVKATYFYENGNIQQVGYFKDGKLEGKWLSYDENGNIQTVAFYSNGSKTGKWLNYSASVCVREIEYGNNELVSVKKIDQLASVEKK